MSKKSYQVDVVDFAYQIVEMHKTLLSQERELEQLREYREKYINLLDSSMEHSSVMMTNLEDALISHDKYEEN